METSEFAKKHENQIRRFLKKIHLKNVDGGDSFRIGGHQIDACGGHERTLLVVECTTQRKRLEGKLSEFRGKAKDIISGFKRHDIYQKYNKHIFIMATKGAPITKSLLDKALKSKGPKIYIWDNQFIQYYSNLESSIKEYAKYDLLGEIGVKPEKSESISLPAFLSKIGKKGKTGLFLFFIDAHDLLKMAYVARRELGHESYYQRMVNRKRLELISKYINKGKFFPNSVIVSLEKGSWDFKKIQDISDNTYVPNWLEIGELTLLNNYRSCWIIDGQHRLYSYSRTTGRGVLCVSAFAIISEQEQAEYFLDINREAKQVPSSLLWDLLGSLSSNTPTGIISNAAKSLRKIKGGIFENKVNVPSLGSGKFSLTNICDSIEKYGLAKQELIYRYDTVRNPYFAGNAEKYVDNLSKGLSEYFTVFYRGIEDELIKEKMQSDGFISVLIGLFKYFLGFIKRKPSNEEYGKFFGPIWNEINGYDEKDIDNLLTSMSSEKGKKAVKDKLIILLRDRYDKKFALGLVDDEPSLADNIERLEPRLNKFVYSILAERIGEDWIKKHEYIPEGRQRKKILEESERFERPPWEFLNFGTTVNTIILNNELWGRIFKDIFTSGYNKFNSKDEFQIAARELWDYRSKTTGHKRDVPIHYPKYREIIIEGYYHILVDILDEYGCNNG